MSKAANVANADNVSVGKPKIGGGVYTAPIGTEVPTDAVTVLSDTFKNLGYVSEDGVTNMGKASGGDINAWGGATVLNVDGANPDKFKVKFIESLNTEVLKTYYGDANVEGNIESGIKVKVNNNHKTPKVWVLDMIMTGGILHRIVIPHGTVVECGDIVYKDNEPVGYETTILAAPDDGGDTHHEYYIKPAAPTPAAT